MTAIRDLHDLVMEPGLINPDEEVPVSLGWLHALYLEVVEACPGHTKCEGGCDELFCDLCGINSPGCAHGRDLCAECRGNDPECRADARDEEWA